MDAHEHGAQLVIRQHHAHGHLVHLLAEKGRGRGLQQLGVAGKGVVRRAGGRQGLLVQGRRDQACDLATQGRLRGPAHATPRQATGGGADTADRRLAVEHRHLQHRQCARSHRLLRSLDRRQLDATHPGRGTAQHGHIARHETAAQSLGLGPEGLEDDFGPDARRIAQGDGQGLHAGLSISMNTWSSPSWAATCAATAGAP